MDTKQKICGVCGKELHRGWVMVGAVPVCAAHVDFKEWARREKALEATKPKRKRKRKKAKK